MLRERRECLLPAKPGIRFEAKERRNSRLFSQRSAGRAVRKQIQAQWPRGDEDRDARQRWRNLERRHSTAQEVSILKRLNLWPATVYCRALLSHCTPRPLENDGRVVPCVKPGKTLNLHDELYRKPERHSSQILERESASWSDSGSYVRRILEILENGFLQIPRAPGRRAFAALVTRGVSRVVGYPSPRDSPARPPSAFCPPRRKLRVAGADS